MDKRLGVIQPRYREESKIAERGGTITRASLVEPKAPDFNYIPSSADYKPPPMPGDPIADKDGTAFRQRL